MMKTLKTLVVVISLCVTCWVLSACNTSKTTTVEQYILPDLTGKTVFNYTDVIDINKVYVSIKNESHNTIPKNEFIRYGNNLQPGSAVAVGTTIEVYFSDGPTQVEDNEAPVLTGVEDIEIPWNSEFDPLAGVEAKDNDIDITDKIKIIILDANKNRIDKIDTKELTTYYVRYSVTDKANNNTTVERKVVIVPIDIDTRYTDNLKIDFEYEGKNFIRDGVGIVTLERCVDGDTASFNVYNPETNSYTNISVRFLGVDTPESTELGGMQQWGKAAKEFTCSKLSGQGVTLVLEADPKMARLDTYERYLAYVWYNGRLLNLELVEEAYSQFNLPKTAKYYQEFFDAEYKTRFTLRRIWGEIDPDCPTCGVKK
ncbi:MAG: DUF5011 domain-containing protein [Bacilli bacterium]|nr:DUF5011 domain-containing protein [Bacilli bacterium]